MDTYHGGRIPRNHAATAADVALAAGSIMADANPDVPAYDPDTGYPTNPAAWAAWDAAERAWYAARARDAARARVAVAVRMAHAARMGAMVGPDGAAAVIVAHDEHGRAPTGAFADMAADVVRGVMETVPGR